MGRHINITCYNIYYFNIIITVIILIVIIINANFLFSELSFDFILL